MSLNLTKIDVCETLSSTLRRWKYPPFITIPTFYIEAWFADSFLYFFAHIPVDSYTNVVPFINQKFEEGVNTSFKNICRVLDQNKADGTEIFELMNDRQFISRQHRLKYNRQITGKGPRGLKKMEWDNYNNSLLAMKYWEGFLLSQKTGFQIWLPCESEGPIELFLNQDTKPLWGMQKSTDEMGITFYNRNGAPFYLNPFPAMAFLFWDKKTKHHRRL